MCVILKSFSKVLPLMVNSFKRDYGLTSEDIVCHKTCQLIYLEEISKGNI